MAQRGEMLRALCMKRLPVLYRGKAYDNALDALNYQLGVIDQMGFNGYFLILWDAMNWGRDHGIRFGPGRGSAAGSVVSYCLHITDIDPIAPQPLLRTLPEPLPCHDAGISTSTSRMRARASLLTTWSRSMELTV